MREEENKIGVKSRFIMLYSDDQHLIAFPLLYELFYIEILLTYGKKFDRLLIRKKKHVLMSLIFLKRMYWKKVLD